MHRSALSCCKPLCFLAVLLVDVFSASRPGGQVVLNQRFINTILEESLFTIRELILSSCCKDSSHRVAGYTIVLKDVAFEHFHEGRLQFAFSKGVVKLTWVNVQLRLNADFAALGSNIISNRTIAIDCKNVSLSIDFKVSIRDGRPAFEVLSVDTLRTDVEISFVGGYAVSNYVLLGVVYPFLRYMLQSFPHTVIHLAVRLANKKFATLKTSRPFNLPPPLDVARLDWSSSTVEIQERHIAIGFHRLVRSLDESIPSYYLTSALPPSTSERDVTLQLAVKEILSALHVFASLGLLSFTNRNFKSDALALLFPDSRQNPAKQVEMKVTLLSGALYAEGNLVNVSSPVQVEFWLHGDSRVALVLTADVNISGRLDLQIGGATSHENMLFKLASPVGALLSFSLTDASHHLHVVESNIGKVDQLKFEGLSVFAKIMEAGVRELSPWLIPLPAINFTIPALHVNSGALLPALDIKLWDYLKHVSTMSHNGIIEFAIEADWIAVGKTMRTLDPARLKHEPAIKKHLVDSMKYELAEAYKREAQRIEL